MLPRLEHMIHYLQCNKNGKADKYFPNVLFSSFACYIGMNVGSLDIYCLKANQTLNLDRQRNELDIILFLTFIMSSALHSKINHTNL
jgi:hypothetical protein